MQKGFMDLTAIIDVFSRYLLGWGLSKTLEAAASLLVLQEAMAEHGKPKMVNNDQGSQTSCSKWLPDSIKKTRKVV
jgi:putative transposase